MFCVISGCSQPSMQDNAETVRSARHTIPAAVEMETLFPGTRHLIQVFFDQERDVHEWQTISWVPNRYEILMSIDVTVDYENHTVTPIGEPHFLLEELSNVNILPDGRAHASYGGPNHSLELTPDQWKTVYKNDGDFKSIGINLDGDEVPHRDEFIRQIQRDLPEISLLD